MTIKFVLLLCLLSFAYQMQGQQCNIQGCLSCNLPNVCAQCQQDYVLQSISTGTSACIKTQSFASKKRLLADNSGNYTDGATGNNNSNIGNYTNCTTIPNCNVCTNTTYCTTCASPYLPNDSGSCLKCDITGCKKCSAQNVCDKCQSKYQLIEQTGLCMSCDIQGCSKCIASGVCGTCVGSLVPSTNGGNCITCDLTSNDLVGCSSCSVDNSCGLCKNGLQKYTQGSGKASVCIKCEIPNCKQCSLDSNAVVCSKCMPGYSATDGKCTQCSFPCKTCTSKDGPHNCATCFTPFYYSAALANGTCALNLIPGCSKPNSSDENKCSECLQGYSLSQNAQTCDRLCAQNCATCTSATVCTECDQGYYLKSGGSCQTCNLKRCSVCSSDGASCSKCIDGFYLLDQQCKSCPGFCKTCSSNKTCQELYESVGIILLIIDGQTVLAVCQGNCITCSNLDPSVCLECAEGHYLKNGKCKKCGGNCLTCDQTNTTKCLSCYPNSFLSSGSCTGCASKCLTCESSSAPDKCLSCKPGFFLKDNDCIQGCPQNCFSCSDPTTCVQCISGYTLYTQDQTQICAPCISSCRTCAKGQPAVCLACGSGFYLKDTGCQACPNNCNSCNAQGCKVCADGFYLTSTQSCAPNCQAPCATCSTQDQTQCLSCIAGYKYDDTSNSCVERIDCNGQCVVCPMGYSLNKGKCIACSTNKCQSCNTDDLTECYSCKPRYYLTNSGVCQSCPSQCKNCLSATGCISCAKGYTKNQNAAITPNGYQCTACQSPCLTCAGAPNVCTSCVQGYRFVGWKCAKKFRFFFRMKFGGTLKFFNGFFFKLLKTLAGALKNANTNAISCNSLKEGSVNMDGQAAPTSDSGSSESGEQLSSFLRLVNGGSVAGLTVESSSVTVPQGSVGQPGNGSSGSNAVGIVLGICIPIGVLLVVGLIFLIIYKKKNAYSKAGEEYDDEGSHKRFDYSEHQAKVDQI